MKKNIILFTIAVAIIGGAFLSSSVSKKSDDLGKIGLANLHALTIGESGNQKKYRQESRTCYNVDRYAAYRAQDLGYTVDFDCMNAAAVVGARLFCVEDDNGSTLCRTRSCAEFEREMN